MRPHLKIVFGMIGLGALLLAGAPAAQATDLSGKTIEWTVPFGVGGGTDVWARFFAPQFSDALPGKPTVVVVNVPGGGSTKGANQFAARAKPTGLEILGTSASTQFPYMLGDPRVRYDYADWVPVLATPTGGVVYVQPDLGVKSAKDIAKLRAQELKFAAQGATRLELVPLLSFEMLELNIKPVFGMKSRGEGRLTFERGESALDFQTTAAYLTNVKALIEQGKAVPLFSLGFIDDEGNIVRDPTFPELPSFVEFYKDATGKEPSGNAFEAWKAFFIAGYSLQKMVVLPKDTSAEMLDAYRDAAKKIVSAPDFLERAGEEIGVYKQALGKVAERHLKDALKMDPQLRAWVRDWLGEKYSVKF